MTQLLRNVMSCSWRTFKNSKWINKSFQ